MTISSRILAALVIALFLLAQTGCASSRQVGNEDRIDRQLTSMDQALDLTDVQASRIRAILVSHEPQQRSGPPPQGGQPGNREGNREPRPDPQALRAEADRQIEAVLTEEQVTKYRNWRASQPQRPEGRVGPPPGVR